MHLRRDLGAVLSQNQWTANTTQSPMVAEPLWLMKKTTILPNLSFWC